MSLRRVAAAVLPLMAVVTIAATTRAQAPSATSAPAPKAGSRGFAYSSSLAPDEGGHQRWADYPVVRHVYTGSPALAAGLREGDVILSVNGRDGTEAEAYHNPRVGDRWTLRVQRGTREFEVSFIITERTWRTDEYVPPGVSGPPRPRR